MGSKIYVGGLPYEVDDQQLNDLFSAYGTIASARVITDRFTGRSRGFGFVKMPNNDEGQAAIDALNESELQGRPLRVREAEERQPRSGGGGGGFQRRGGGGGGRGGYGGRDGGRQRYR